MQRLNRYLGSLLVGAALIAPVGIQAKNCPDKGYYDRDRKDCHNWDDHQARAYQSWEKRPLTRNLKERLEVWNRILGGSV
jgi:hypothetical protein